jgi:uncharacterized membrane protein YecN with MAPEG domain
MALYYGVAIVTLLSGFLCIGMGFTVARAHRRAGIPAPTMVGDPYLERAVRGHANTIEWMPIFLPAMWLLAIYWSPFWAAILGALWIVARIVYFLGYLAAPEKRFPGFGAQAVIVWILALGALGRILWLMYWTSATSL